MSHTHRSELVDSYHFQRRARSSCASLGQTSLLVSLLHDAATPDKFHKRPLHCTQGRVWQPESRLRDAKQVRNRIDLVGVNLEGSSLFHFHLHQLVLHQPHRCSRLCRPLRYQSHSSHVQDDTITFQQLWKLAIEMMCLRITTHSLLSLDNSDQS